MWHRHDKGKILDFFFLGASDMFGGVAPVVVLKKVGLFG